MSNFINPFDLLEIETTDSDTIKKAKRRKLADIELNDGFLEIGNQKVSRSEFIKLVDELDDNKTKNMYFFIKRDAHLNKLLLNNDVRFFFLYQPHKAYQNQDFINFISPYFAESFSQLLLKAFKTGNSSHVNKLFSVPLLVNQEHTDKLYKNLSRLLSEKIEELEDIKNSVGEGIDDEDVSNIMEAFESIIDIASLNSLPSYFQKQRNDIAMMLWNIDYSIWGIIKDLQVSYNIIYYALKIEIDGTTKIRLSEALKQLNDIGEKQKKTEKEQEVFQVWGDVLSEIRRATDDIENSDISVNRISGKINKLKIKQLFSIAELNNLPDSFNEINKFIALSLKNLSVVVWNKTNDSDIAIDVIVLARKIKTDLETQEIIDENYNDLQQAIKNNRQHQENEAIVECYSNVFGNVGGLIEKIENGTISVNNIGISQIKSFINIADLNNLSSEHDEIRNQLALVLRSLSISVYNAFEDVNLAMEIIKYAQLIRINNDTYNNLANAYNQLQQIVEKNNQREAESRFNINIRGDVVSINNDKVIYKNKSLVTNNIDKIKFGVYITSINGIRSSYYTIWYGDKSGNFIEIECNRLLNDTATVENQYRQILDASYNTVIPCVLKNIENYFNNRQSIIIGDFTVDKEGLSYITGSLLWKETHFVKWQDVTFSSIQGVLQVKNKQKNKVIGSFGFRDAWNAVIFQLIKEYVIGIKG
jgi:hypothetical protein